MNWFTKLFSRKPKASQSGENRTSTSYQFSATTVTQSATQPQKLLQQHVTLEQLKKLIPLRDLDEASLTAIHHASLWYKKGATLFNLGQPSDHVFYLLDGHIQMQPDGVNGYELDSRTTLYNLPLNSGKFFGATATALSDVVILQVSVDLNYLWVENSRNPATEIELIDIELPDQIANTRFFRSFADAYQNNKLRLPSLPDVALKLKEAMRQDIGVKDAAEIIHMDPPIVTKLIQVANSALYATGLPITNCNDAISRIGLNATRNLVMSISLKQLFNSANPELMKMMQALWKNSLYVSSLSFVLAQESKVINPEDALLAGLIADIGALPLLHFAEQLSYELTTFDELETSIHYLRAPVGALVLHTLGFSEQLSNIPRHAENWLYDSGPAITVEDIVILAKLHSYFGAGKARGLPYINSVPAYSKLKDGVLNPDFSLNVLNKAQNRINAAMRMLS